MSPDGARVYVTGDNDATGDSSDIVTIAYDATTGADAWLTRTDGPGVSWETASDLVVSPDGSRTFVAGTHGAGREEDDYLTAAYDAATGGQLWVATYHAPNNGTAYDVARSMGISAHGERVYVTGESCAKGSYLGCSPSSTRADFATVAYDAASGAQLWASRFNGSGGLGTWDWANSLAVSPDGERVYVTGASESVSGFTTVAYEPSTGTQLWVAGYDGLGSGGGEAYDVAASVDGARVFVTGESFAPTGSRYTTIGYLAETGTELWVSDYNGSVDGRDTPSSIAVGPDGTTVFVTGASSQGAGRYDDDYATVAYDALTGVHRWVARYDGPASNDDQANAVAVSLSGTVVFVTGGSVGSRSIDYATVAYRASSGAQLRVARYEGPGADFDNPYSLGVGPEGSARVYVTGESSYDYGTVAYGVAST